MKYYPLLDRWFHQSLIQDSTQEIIRIHCGRPHIVGFIGFQDLSERWTGIHSIANWIVLETNGQCWFIVEGRIRRQSWIALESDGGDHNEGNLWDETPESESKSLKTCARNQTCPLCYDEVPLRCTVLYLHVHSLHSMSSIFSVRNFTGEKGEISGVGGAQFKRMSYCKLHRSTHSNTLS